MFGFRMVWYQNNQDHSYSYNYCSGVTLPFTQFSPMWEHICALFRLDLEGGTSQRPFKSCLTSLGQELNNYSPPYSKTELEHRNQRWQLFGQIWNGGAVWFWNTIQYQDHSTTQQLSTIRNLNAFGIQVLPAGYFARPLIHSLN